ncbi:MAG TPA: hypothetical protein VNZ25_10300 [Candidatus Angelobacter sp.]|jgi:hypothetical protein|nr:hypothetical protein [Candidatus Angelobacter sp.]
MAMHLTPQVEESTSWHKPRRLRYVQLVLISPSILVLALYSSRYLGVFQMARIFGWLGRAVFYTSPLLFLYNILVYFLLARRLNKNHSWVETIMMAIVILSSFLLLIAIVFLIMSMSGKDIMPVPAD